MSARSPFRLPASRRRASDDVARELRFHLEACEADLVAAGMSPDDARREARRRFGDLDSTAAECLSIEGARQAGVDRRERLSAVWHDVRHAVRSLRRAPGFTAAAVLTLGLGLGATTAMFSVVDAVLLRPLPVPDAERVVAIDATVGGEQRDGSPALLAAWSEQSRQLRAIAATRRRDATLFERGAATRVSGLAVSAAFFDVLGLPPVLGRGIGAADDVPGAPPVVVLGHRLWAGTFAADPAIVGRSLTLDGTPRTVIGVLPATADASLGAREFLVPLALPSSQRENFTPYLSLVARLAPGATPASAARELDAIVDRVGAPARVDDVPLAVRVTPLHRTLGDAYRRPLLLMLGAVAAVLAIACANVATLVLVRSVGRTRELGVRAALGAGRGRLVRQLAAEHLVLAALATLVAVPVALLATRALVRAAPAEVPRLAGAGLDGRALAVVVLLGVVASVLAGVGPALYRARIDVRAALHGTARGSTDRGGDRWRRLLVALQVAAAVVLLTGAGLLIRSSAALARVQPGFDVAHVLTARLALPRRDYPEVPRVVAAAEAMLAAARREPGVASAALVSRVPLGGSAASVDVERVDAGAAPVRVNAALRITSADYFRSIGIPLLAGRDLRAADDARAPRVLVVNAALARRLGGADAVLGRRIRTDNAAFADPAGRPVEMEVVGVVGDVRDGGPRSEPQPEMFAPLAQVSDEPWDEWIGREMLLVARTPGSPAAVAAALRRAVASVDARVPLYDVQSTAERLGGAVAIERFGTRLLTLLGLAGLALAALGIHGVVAYVTAQRGREVGIRLALGASVAQTVTLVVRQSLRPVLAGALSGLALAVLAGRAASGLLFGVSPLDPASLVVAAMLLAAVGVVACWGPARRLARVDPASSLRTE